MPFVTPVRSFRALSLGLAACVFVLPAAAVQGETIKSDRTARDVDDSAAAQQADLKAVAATATGNYVDAGGIPFTYRVYAPPATEPGAKYPMYIYWGTDVPLILRSSQARYPCYVVSVNCGPKVADWKARSASALRVVAETLIAKDPQIDASRIYTGGFSKCGGAAWMAVLSYPDFFAAIAPIT
jgi:predicted peptidase